MRKNRTPSLQPDRYTKGEISVDGFNLTAIIEWDGDKWNKIAFCDSGQSDEALAKDIKNARLFACSPEFLKVCQEVAACLANAPERNYERDLLEKIIDKATK